MYIGMRSCKQKSKTFHPGLILWWHLMGYRHQFYWYNDLQSKMENKDTKRQHCVSKVT